LTVLIDTNIAIHLRDGDPAVLRRYSALLVLPMISVITIVELAGGVASTSADDRSKRSQMIEKIARDLSILPFEPAVADIYREIVNAVGFSRSRILDRMIAATALFSDIPLATINIRDFRDIPGLQIEDWSQ
jgi:tRNA(fMet)-specific endonuclease VapC